MLQTISPTGNVSAPLALFNESSYYRFDNIAITSLFNGNIAVTWQQQGLYGQIFDILGSPVTNVFMISLNLTTNLSNNQAITGLFNGNFVVIWNSLYHDNCPIGVYGQLFLAMVLNLVMNFVLIIAILYHDICNCSYYTKLLHWQMATALLHGQESL